MNALESLTRIESLRIAWQTIERLQEESSMQTADLTVLFQASRTLARLLLLSEDR